MSQLAWLWEGLQQLLAPPCCIACGRGFSREDFGFGGFCAPCGALILPCAAEARPPSPDAALFYYGGPLAEALRRLKYRGCPEVAVPLGALLRLGGQPYAGRVDRVVPIPLHPQRLRERGFNQCALIAGPLARRLGVPLDVMSLVRGRPTPRQVAFGRVERHENVRGAFVARPRLLGARVLLVDDVRTSGATLAAATTALKDAGCSEVYRLALASAE